MGLGKHYLLGFEYSLAAKWVGYALKLLKDLVAHVEIGYLKVIFTQRNFRIPEYKEG